MSRENGYYAALIVGSILGSWLISRYDQLGRVAAFPMLIGLVLGIFYYAWWFWKNQPKA